jgi:hypothetical protein
MSVARCHENQPPVVMVAGLLRQSVWLDPVLNCQTRVSQLSEYVHRLRVAIFEVYWNLAPITPALVLRPAYLAFPTL